MGRVLYGPSWHGPSWFWAELSCTRLRVLETFVLENHEFILFIDHARMYHLTDFASFIDSQCHV